MNILAFESSCDETSASVVSFADGNFSVKSNIIASQIETHRVFGGVVPDNMDDLLSLPGVGRKIANLILGDVYGKPALVADTHCIRICGRFGMYPTDMKDPTKVEMTMKELIAPEEQSDFCHRIVQFGRDTCSARSPKCFECLLKDICGYKDKNNA